MEKGNRIITLKLYDFVVYHWLKENNGKLSVGLPRAGGNKLITSIINLKELGLINYTDLKVNRIHEDYGWYIYQITLDNFSVNPIKIHRVTKDNVYLLLEDSEGQSNQQS